MRSVVTGGAGFIGCHVVDGLLARGDDVIVVDNLFEGRMENIAHAKDKIKFLNLDIRDTDTLKKEFKGVDNIFHQAAMKSVPQSLKAPKDYNDVNINGTLSVLEAARANDVKRVVFASSSSVYGDTTKLPEKESDPVMPLSPYALTKAAGEMYMNMYHKLYNMETVSLRYFNVFGPKQDPFSEYANVIPLFIKAIQDDKVSVIFDDGEQTRDFTYISNVVDANLLASTVKNIGGNVFNVADGKAVSVNYLYNSICRILGKDIKPKYTAPRAGDVKHTLADPAKAREVLGHAGRIGFDEGLKKTIEWFS